MKAASKMLTGLLRNSMERATQNPVDIITGAGALNSVWLIVPVAKRLG